ncbi:MAG: hypothetical protein NZ990_01080 [Myxococcota bacterium]|nr:hypothetical protein [Myxococcota bacterium]
MNLEAERKLKFDRRMQGRPGWASEEELEVELASLPDCSAKIAEEPEAEPTAPEALGAEPEAP